MKIIQEKYNFLKPYRSLNLVRMGRNEDGGYVVDNNSITLNNTLITFGMGLDWSFELDYLQKNNHGKILIYDHTVNFFTFFLPFLKSLKRFILLRKNIHDVNDRFKKLAKYLNFILSNRVSFFNKKISLNISKNTTNLNQIIKNNNIQKFILKIDIEGAEYEIIDEIIMNSNKIDMLIIEFHDIEKKNLMFLNFIKKIINEFKIIHIHGNNHTGVTEDGLPITLEITFLNNYYNLEKNSNEMVFPIKDLDYPNNPNIKDHFFTFR